MERSFFSNYQDFYSEFYKEPMGIIVKFKIVDYRLPK